VSFSPAADFLILLERYLERFPEEADATFAFAGFARSGRDVFERTRVDGHFTASCWLVSRDGARVLLTHHRKLDRWLQLGGHADGDPDLVGVALREAHEESGLPDLLVDAEIFDLDAHLIPARANEPAHTHWDVRFIVRCAGDEAFAVSAESHALAWVPIPALLDDAGTDASLRRMAAKWLARSR
jgi:8-oxo-dGTP pyrophosphatase MutT (NUDIX family)